MKRSSTAVFGLWVLCLLSFSVYGEYPGDFTVSVMEEPDSRSKIAVASSSDNFNENQEAYYKKVEVDPSFKDSYKGNIYDYDRKEKEKKPKDIIEENPKKRKALFTLSAAFMRILLFVILGIIVLLIAYYILKNAGGFHFGSGRKKIDVQSAETTSEEDSEDIDTNDFESLILQAKSEKDFRKAVRFYYLRVLQKLSDNKLIQWDKDKTDYDYYLELAPHSIREDFYGNAYIFDHIWYGNFEINEKEFQLAESLFVRTLNKLK